jgi:hypothetical protein
MPEPANEFIFAVLRPIQADIGDVKGDVREIKGSSVRMDRRDEQMGRIIHRLELTKYAK